MGVLFQMNVYSILTVCQEICKALEIESCKINLVPALGEHLVVELGKGAVTTQQKYLL